MGYQMGVPKNLILWDIKWGFLKISPNTYNYVCIYVSVCVCVCSCLSVCVCVCVCVNVYV